MIASSQVSSITKIATADLERFVIVGALEWSVTIGELSHLAAWAHENMSTIPDNGRLCRDFRGIFQ